MLTKLEKTRIVAESVRRLHLIQELISDVKEHAEIEQLLIERMAVGCGCRIRLFSDSAAYDGEVSRIGQSGDYSLRCYRKAWGERLQLLFEGDDSIGSFEQLRGKILDAERVEWSLVQPSKLKNVRKVKKVEAEAIA